MSALLIRQAGLPDVDFLVEAIVAAEKSATDRLSLATLFGLSDEQAIPLIKAMLEEEVDGCELSVNSFLLAFSDDRPVAAVAGWIEGAADGPPSSLLKSNLIAFTYPPACMDELRISGPLVAPLRIVREPGALQIEYVYVREDFRGRGAARSLIEQYLRAHAAAPKAQVQAFANNFGAIALYRSLGFNITVACSSPEPGTMKLLPWNEKVLMERGRDPQQH